MTDIARQSPHSIIIESGIIRYLIKWLRWEAFLYALVDMNHDNIVPSISPQHSITDTKCKELVFQICQLIAKNSDPGRKALIEENILPILRHLAINHIASNVISACELLNALAHTGTYRREIIAAGVKTVMQQITRYAFHLFPSGEHI
jgi:hypothetical protein